MGGVHGMAALATAGVPRFHLIAAPSTSSPFIWTKTADHLRGRAGDKLGLVRRDGPPYPPKTPRPRLCAERRTPVPASVRHVRGFVRRDGPAYLPRYASSAALCGETDPRTCLGTPRPRLCAERRTRVPASVRLVRGFVRRDAPRTCLGTPRPRLCAERRTRLPASVRLVRGLVRRDAPRTCLGTPRPRPCAERRTPVPASVRLVRGLVRRDRPPYLPQYASSAALCGETHPRTRLRRHIRGFVRKAAHPRQDRRDGNSLTAH